MKKALAKAGIPQFSCIGLIFLWDTVNIEISVTEIALRACSPKHNNIFFFFFSESKDEVLKRDKATKELSMFPFLPCFFSLECFDQLLFHPQKCQSQNILKFGKISTVNCRL